MTELKTIFHKVGFIILFCRISFYTVTQENYQMKKHEWSLINWKKYSTLPIILKPSELLILKFNH